MKKIIRDVVILVIALIADACVFFLVPLVNHLKGYDLGLAVLLPMLVVPVISLVIGLLYDRPIQLLFPPVTVIMSIIHFLIIYKCTNIVYIVYFALVSVLLMAIGMGISFVVKKIVLFIRKKIPAKN